ncbi:MAG: Nramp family divalent metal transporter [Clostridia bacterium]|nr:Nramp family divalent metal transporter [Clostridia bacterium]
MSKEVNGGLLDVDPYRLRDEDVLEPPQRWRQSFKYLGPGMILAAAVVGSGEVIAVPILGAKVGMAGLGLILLSCIVKLIFLEELARYAVVTGKSPLEAFSDLPGPRIFNIHLVGWLWMMYIFSVILQQGGILGTAGTVIMNFVPALDERFWAAVLVVVSCIAYLKARYDTIQNVATFLVVVFSLTAVIASVLLMFTPYRVTLADLAQGFSFAIPRESWQVAFGAFGITGLASAEIVSYHYWCLEKGYARNVGPRHDTPEWKKRAKGWISVLHKDIIVTATVFTFVTAAFYVLGAKVLHTLGILPSGLEVLKSISAVFTEIYGGWSFYLFMIGAFFAMYSTFYANAAAYARFLLDFFLRLGSIKVTSGKQRTKWSNGFTILLLVVFALGYFAIRTPVALVFLGGITGTLMIPVIAWASVYLGRKIDKGIALSAPAVCFMYICAVIVTIIGAVTLYDLIA